jgi:hypothetical protein
MALRFKKVDDSDIAAKRERHPWLLLIGLAFLAVVYIVDDSVNGNSVGKDLAWIAVFGVLWWYVAPLYYEFHFRTKEIDGKVSAIEDATHI